MVGPNLFLVGAAKAGTTSISAYLGAHPQVFMSAVKAPSYFAQSLGARTAYSESLERYLELFADGAEATFRGEASPSYLIDPDAAQRIRDFCPDARIIILLRNPLDALLAIHSEARKYALEPERNFVAALAASDHGRPRVEARHGGFWTRYRETVRYPEQVERYLAVFPADHVFVGLYDDLLANPAGVYREILEFLGVDPTFQPPFERLNPYRGEVRSYWVQRLVIGRGVDPGTRGHGPAHLARLRRALARWNMAAGPRRPLDAAAHGELAASLRPDVERLSEILGRDLRGWLSEPSERAAGNPWPRAGAPSPPATSSQP